MKKPILFFLTLILSVALFFGCSSAKRGDRATVVVTNFPAYDWVRCVLGERQDDFDVVLLTEGNADLHSFQPSVADMVTIASADLFVYVGGESDRWVQDVPRAKDGARIDLSLLDVLGQDARGEEIVPGMQTDEDEDEGAKDEHVWLSLRCAARFVSSIADALGVIDVPHADEYAANADAYIAKLNALDARYADCVAGGARRVLLFGDRFPFLYLTGDYGLDYYAAFAGCSAESEASFETIAYLARRVDEEGLPVILTIESSDGRVAETIRASSRAKDAKILTLHSLQSVSARDVARGISYLSVMEDNLSVLAEALR